MPYDRDRHGPHRAVGPGFHERVYALVTRVPPGRVTTYGEIAAALGLRTAARHVGFALAALSAERDDLPWHRIVNARGCVSARGEGGASREQLRRLRSEGIRVAADGRIADFDRHLLRADVLRVPSQDMHRSTV